MDIDFTPKKREEKTDRTKKSYLILKGKERETLEKIKDQLNYSWSELLTKMIDLLCWYLEQQSKSSKKEKEEKK